MLIFDARSLRNKLPEVHSLLDVSLYKIKIPQEYTSCEILCVDIFKDSFKQNFICAYRPPFANRQINDDLMRCLNILCDIEFVSTICTDFNLLNFD